MSATISSFGPEGNIWTSPTLPAALGERKKAPTTVTLGRSLAILAEHSLTISGVTSLGAASAASYLIFMPGLSRSAMHPANSTDSPTRNNRLRIQSPTPNQRQRFDPGFPGEP